MLLLYDSNSFFTYTWPGSFKVPSDILWPVNGHSLKKKKSNYEAFTPYTSGLLLSTVDGSGASRTRLLRSVKTSMKNASKPNLQQDKRKRNVYSTFFLAKPILNKEKVFNSQRRNKASD